jgi:hypothetical protein
MDNKSSTTLKNVARETSRQEAFCDVSYDEGSLMINNNYAVDLEVGNSPKPSWLLER